MKNKRFICFLLVFVNAVSYIGYGNLNIYSSEIAVSDIYEENTNLPDIKAGNEIETDEIVDFAFPENQGSFEPLNIEPYSGISIMATSTDSNIVAGVKQFQQYINANLPMTYLGTALAIDGSPGPATQTAAIKLIQYRLNQAGAGLTVDGGFGIATQNAFSTFVGTIERYDTGIWVYILQGLMYCHDYNVQGFDGSYGVSGGTGLLNAVNAFKSTQRISDGGSGTVGV